MLRLSRESLNDHEAPEFGAGHRLEGLQDDEGLPTISFATGIVMFETLNKTVAFGETRMVVATLGKADTDYTLRMGGRRYLDSVERRKGQWLIADRKVLLD